MKRVLLFYLANCFILFAFGTAMVENSPKDESSLIEHFSAYLSSGKPSPFKNGKQFKLGQAEHYRQLVWEAWKTANSRLEEERLLPLRPLSEANNSRWQLPASLEPNAVMPYYYGFKGDAKPEGGYPLFVYTHGSGSKHQEWKTGLAICQNFDDAPSAYFIPQIPNEGEYYRWWQKAKQYAWEKLLRQAFITEDINPNRIYMFGISEGGYGSQRLASFYADYLAAAGPMAGGEPLKNAPAENCANIGFSLRTGADDRGFYRNMLTGCIKEEFKHLQEQHPEFYKYWIELIPGMGHGIDYRPTPVWLKQFSRNPYPDYFCWEDFEMDGLHRKGFYNLAVEERPDKELRTRYEMTIKDNHVTLNIDNVKYECTQKDPNWGIELKFKKSFVPATKGRFTIYLCEELVDLKRPVTVTINGKQVFKGKVKPNLKNMVNSCTTFFDPCRIYPAAIEVKL